MSLHLHTLSVMLLVIVMVCLSVVTVSGVSRKQSATVVMVFH